MTEVDVQRFLWRFTGLFFLILGVGIIILSMQSTTAEQFFDPYVFLSYALGSVSFGGGIAMLSLCNDGGYDDDV